MIALPAEGFSTDVATAQHTGLAGNGGAGLAAHGGLVGTTGRTIILVTSDSIPLAGLQPPTPGGITHRQFVVAPRTPRTGRYGDMVDELRGTGQQANHLNQNATYRGIIPEEDGLSHALRGNAFTEPGTPHFEFHWSLEGFWNQYRRGGASFGSSPTNAQYGQALRQALEAAGLSPAEAAELAAQAARQRAAFGLLDDAFVPRIPGRLPQRRP